MSTFSRKLRPARRINRGQPSARIWQFEQLESRAMLAVMGPMPYYGADHGPQAQNIQESYRFEAVLFAQPIQQYSAGEQVNRGWGGEPGQAGFRDDRFMFRQVEVVEVWSVGPQNLTHSNFTQSAPSPPRPLEPRTTITIAQAIDSYDISIAAAGGQPNTSASSRSKNTPISQPKDFWTPPPANGRKGPDDGRHYDGMEDYADEYLQVARNTASSVLAQSMAREADSAAFVWTTALDAALQSYTSQLLLATSATSGQLATSVKASDQAVPTSDATDYFIRLGEPASQELFAASADAIAQERAAVEAILNSLNDANDLTSKLDGADVANAIPAPRDQDGQIADLVFGSTFDLADADGGMILLKATGDANESPINLASVAEAHPDLFNGHIGVEPSVGLYQAIDMGFEELSATESLPVAKPIAQPSQQSKPDNHYSASTSKVSNATNSRKSAAALTASALAGGLLWVSSRNRTEEDDTEERSTR